MKNVTDLIKPSMEKTTLRLALGFCVALLAVGSAHADIRHDRDWNRHAVAAHRYWHGPHPARGYVYAPPTVYAPPPPPSPGINLILPLHFN